MQQKDLMALRACVDKLPEKQRIAISITLTEDNLSYSEVAQLMSLSLSNIKVILFRAREGLQKCLGVMS